METKRLKVTITWEYDANPEAYDTDIPTEMVAVDQANWDMVPELCLQQLEENWDKDSITVKVEYID